MTALVLLDLDGTLYQAGTPVPGAVEAVKRLRAAGHTLRFFTTLTPRRPVPCWSAFEASGWMSRRASFSPPWWSPAAPSPKAPAPGGCLAAGEVVAGEEELCLDRRASGPGQS
jgi:hypothetical protein